MREKLEHLVNLAETRGQNNAYGDPLRCTGGVLNQYGMVERKMDRLRSQVYQRILEDRPINPGYQDTIPDQINYLMFLWLMLEDEAPVK